MRVLLLLLQALQEPWHICWAAATEGLAMKFQPSLAHQARQLGCLQSLLGHHLQWLVCGSVLGQQWRMTSTSSSRYHGLPTQKCTCC
jgi:hypothetical protein